MESKFKKWATWSANAAAALVGAGALALFMLPAAKSAAFLQPSDVQGERFAARSAVMSMVRAAPKNPDAGCGLLRSAEQMRAWHASIDEVRASFSLPVIEHPVVDDAAIEQKFAALGCEYPEETPR